MRSPLLSLLFVASIANAQFSPGQILTAQQLNNQFALYLPLAGGALTGPLTVPTLTVTNGLAIASLSPVTANTVLANATSSSANPTAFAMPSCSTTNSALQWASGTGFTCYGSSAVLGSNTFTGNQVLAFSGPQVTLNDTSGTGQDGIYFQENGTPVWAIKNASGATGSFQVTRYVSGTNTDNPISVYNSTGLVTLADGIASNSSSNAITGGAINNASVGATTASTGAFTTLSASGAVSGTGFANLLAPYAPLASPTFTGTATAANLTASGTVSGTGFSSYLASPPAIGGTAAASGKFTTLQATSTITPSSTAGIVGTTTNDSANAGSLGEYQSATTAGAGITSGVMYNATSISLTAGDWDVSGTCLFNAASTTVPTGLACGISTTSATLVVGGGTAQTTSLQTTFSASTINYMSTPVVRISIASTTTVYLVGQASFTTSTMTSSGVVRARRVR